MSTAEILSLISTISFAVAVISFVLAVFFWFFFRIPSVIGDLSGRTARRSIAKMRTSNESAGGQGYKPSATNVNRGKRTDTMRHAQKLELDFKGRSREMPSGNGTEMPETGLLSSNKASAADAEYTELLVDDATGLLVDDEATVALHDEPKQIRRTDGKKLTMLEEVMLIHTDEVID